MQQEPLFVGAPTALVLSAIYEVPDGWRLRVAMRRDGEQWADAQEALYWHLTTSELVDVLLEEVPAQLMRSPLTWGSWEYSESR